LKVYFKAQRLHFPTYESRSKTFSDRISRPITVSGDPVQTIEDKNIINGVLKVYKPLSAIYFPSIDKEVDLFIYKNALLPTFIC
jgi:hypothetical protein